MKYRVYHCAAGANETASEDRIRGWYADAIANGEAEAGLTDMPDIMLALEDTGHVTFDPEPIPCAES